jgi:hypothetical protein
MEARSSYPTDTLDFRRYGVHGLLTALVCGALAGACGGQPKQEPVAAPPKPIAPVVEAPPPKPPEPPPDAGIAEPVAETPAPATSTPPEASEPKRMQKPIDMITSRDAAFLVDYANSDPKAKALGACEKESKGDAEKQGVCLTKARDKFMPDVLRFRRDSETVVSLLVYKRTGSALRELWIGVVELSEPSEGSVKVKLTGKQKGARPLWRGKNEVVISVPNEYSIEFDDPEFGHLRYDAKIGLVTQ